MLNLKGMSSEYLRQRAAELEIEANEFDTAKCHRLAALKRRDASFYRRQLQPQAA